MEARLGAETHVSWVFFAGDRALKIYKPVRTDVLDASSVEARRALCEQEVAVNRRFSPHAYVGAASIEIGDLPYEHAVVMHRFDDDQRLSARLDAPTADDDIRSVARRIAVVHGEAPVLEADAADSVAGHDALLDRIIADIDGLGELTSGVIPADVIDRLTEFATRFLAGRGDLLAARIRNGHVIDGHGDLLAEDIFLTPTGPVLLDALAFDDHLRWGDVLADLGFLVMDLHRLGHPELGRVLMHAYASLSGEHHPGSLAHYYVAQRAIVRAKIGALRCRQLGADSSWQQVVELVHLAAEHLDRAQVRMLLVGGIPGAGKTSIAASVADAMGWVHLSSDEHRRDLGLLDGAENYDETTKDRVYDSLLDHTRSLLRNGTSVVLDSAWDLDRRRSAARALAAEAHASLHEVRCVVPVDVARRRVAGRETSLSRATPDVVELLARAFETWASAHELDTSGSLSDVVARLVTQLPSRVWTADQRRETG